MKEPINTAETYDDLVGFVNEQNLKSDLSEFLDEEYEYKPSIKPKKFDPEYPEQWQTLLINFSTLDDYRTFMDLMGEFPDRKLKVFHYSEVKTKSTLMDFFGD